MPTDLKINRITVHKVFQRLEKAGLLRSEVGRGTFVAANGDGAAQSASAGAGGGFNGEPVKPEVARSVRRLREGYAGGLRQLLAIERRPGTINLSGGVPSPANIPAGLIERLTRDVFRKNPARIYEYCGPAGMLELREALRERLARRGVSVTSDEIIITNGSQQAISLAAAWARDESRAALCETPTYTGVPGCMMLFGHAVQSVPWENGAPNLDTLARPGGRPPGGLLPLPRLSQSDRPEPAASPRARSLPDGRARPTRWLSTTRFSARCALKVKSRRACIRCCRRAAA